MGLLEKAQQKKVTVNNKVTKKNEKEIGEDTKHVGLLEKAQQKKVTVDNIVIKNEKEIGEVTKIVGLLEKAQQRKQNLPEIKSDDPEKKKIYDGIKTQETKGKEVIEEKTGFGWNGLGSRRIVFDHNINEYIYEVSEPVLNEGEIETKDELSRLFKMLADVNISNMSKVEKQKYLEETLEQIIIDNDIRFIGRKKKKEEKDENTKKKSLKELFSLKKTKEKNQKHKPEKKDKNTIKKSLKELFSLKKTKEKNEKNKPEKKDKNTKKKSLKELFLLKKKKEEPNLRKEQLAELEKRAKRKIFYHIFKEFLGYGKIDIIMEDEGIEDISCDGYKVPIFIYHKKYDEITTNVKFENDNELDSFVVRLAQICGKQISIYSPIVDGKLPDGSRLQTTLARTVTKPSTFTIRRFKENPLTPVDLIDFKSLSLEMAAYFWIAIENGSSILFCGGTASGKTTALNALSLFIPSQHKIVSIEDTREISLPHNNWIAGTTREGFSTSDEKTGKDIDMFDLIRAALRQRPKVVMVGEVRGREAYSLFQAMATGHTSYSTVHASDIHTLIQRLENPPISLPRALLTSLDIIVFINAISLSGKSVRRMTSVTEIVKLDPDTNQLIFMEPFKWVSKTDDRFESGGSSKILNNIRLQNNWTEEDLLNEIENRMKILNWMLKNNIRDYLEVGKIVSDYAKYPEQLLKKIREDKQK